MKNKNVIIIIYKRIDKTNGPRKFDVLFWPFELEVLIVLEPVPGDQELKSQIT